MRGGRPSENDATSALAVHSDRRALRDHRSGHRRRGGFAEQVWHDRQRSGCCPQGDAALGGKDVELRVAAASAVIACSPLYAVASHDPVSPLAYWTTIWPIIHGCGLQLYVYVPAVLKVIDVDWPGA